MRIARTAARLCLAAGIFAAAAADAADFGVTPTLVELGPQKAREALTISNAGDKRAVIQARVLAWRQEGEQELQVPSQDLIVTPPIFTVDPGQRQIIRIGLRKPPETPARELGYRLELEEVPDRTEATGTALRIVLKLSLPVFYRPPEAAPALTWEARQLSPAAIRLSVRNTGSAHAKITELELASPGSGTPLARHEGTIYVLPGGVQEITLKPAGPLPADPIRIMATTNTGRIETNAVLQKP
jgi:fimbrial chaperone protein